MEDVRRHLEEVDNVPLLVSLYTDVTKNTTKEMVDIFQEYNDTVIAVGLSHLPRNDGIFSSADIAVGIDVLLDARQLSSTRTAANADDGHEVPHTVFDAEVELVSALSSHACAFRFQGVSSLSHLSAIIEQGRASLESAVAAGKLCLDSESRHLFHSSHKPSLYTLVVFFLASSLSFSIFILLTVCSPSTTIPHVPIMGTVVFLQIVLPLLGLSMAFANSLPASMKRCPAKNDTKVTFAKREGYKLFQTLILKAVPPAVFCQLLHLIAFGELLLSFEPDLVAQKCGSADAWYGVIRCHELKDYSGDARVSAGIVVFAIFVLTNVLLSTTYIDRFEPLLESTPWKRNHMLVPAAIVLSTGTVIATAASAHEGTGSALPWYFYILSIALPCGCMVWNEYWKKFESQVETRAEKLRRLHFDTRLGAWSPK